MEKGLVFFVCVFSTNIYVTTCDASSGLKDAGGSTIGSPVSRRT